MLKRIFDIVFSFTGLMILLPLFVLVAVVIRLESRGPVFFRQERVGKDFRIFRIWKFRSMKEEQGGNQSLLTGKTDDRITRVGRFLRKYKVDELPQLMNVLAGEMSFVGPRPEVKKYVDLYSHEEKKILSVRPGITDPASIRFSNESELLVGEDPEKIYVEKIMPEKIKMYLAYIEKRSFMADMLLIWKTVFSITGKRVKIL